MTIVGARPQFIKAAPVSHALKNVGIAESIIHTGQHSDANMSEVFFNEMDIPKPEFFLGVTGLSHGAMTGEMLRKIEEVLVQRKPDVVIVYGDTNSTLAGALAAAKLNIPIAHIEAGLRSFNARMPEEINRTLTDRMSRWLFCPTSTAVKNLSAEGYSTPTYRIHQVGDVMLDAALHFKKYARWPAAVPKQVSLHPFLLCTLHRQESVDDPTIFSNLIEAVASIATEVPVVWPIHPRAKNAMNRFGLKLPNVHIVPPASYFEMLALLDHCDSVLTDSGGLQKEAAFFGKHCLVPREESEWIELVEAKAVTLCGTSKADIVSRFHENNISPDLSHALGRGDASEKIVRVLQQDL